MKQAKNRRLSSFGYFSRFDAACAHIDFSNAPLFNNRTNSLKVGVESFFGQVMGMTDIVANQRFFSANCTFF